MTEIMKNFPKAVLFDLGGTLLRVTRLEREAAISWLLRPAEYARSEAIKPQLLELYLEIRRSLRAGRTEFPIRGFLNLARDWAAASPAEVTEDEVELEFWKRLCSMGPLPGVGHVLTELRRRGIRTGVVSNSFCTSNVLRYELDRNGLLDAFQFVISSADYGIQKPHPVIFKVALARLGCDPSEAWFVGDNFEKDIVGASAVGMTAVWLNQEDVSHELPNGSLHIKGWHEFLPMLAGHQRENPFDERH